MSEDMKNALDWLNEIITNPNGWRMFYSDSETKSCAEATLELLKEQEAVDKNAGEWKNGHCSCCGEDVSSMLDTWTNVQSFLYCPHCGAKMEE